MKLTYCDWKWVWCTHPDFRMPVLQNHCEMVAVIPTESGTLMGKGRKPVSWPYHGWSALILTGLSFPWVFLSMPRKFLYVISNYKRIFEDDKRLNTAFYFCFMYVNVSTLPFCQVTPIPHCWGTGLRSYISYCYQCWEESKLYEDTYIVWTEGQNNGLLLSKFLFCLWK